MAGFTSKKSRQHQRAFSPPPGRAAVFVVALAFIVLGPLSRQVFGAKTHHLRAWVMFSGIALGAMDARFYQRHADGSRTELDPFAELGQKRPDQVRDRRLRGTRSVWQVARRICRRRGVGFDLRVVARRASEAGWVRDFRGRENLCLVLRNQGKRPAQKRRRGKR